VSAREEVIRRIRAALHDRPAPGEVDRSYRRAGARAVDLELFVERVEDYRATVHRCSEDELPALLARLLPRRVVVPAGTAEEWLTGLAHVVRDDPPLGVRELDAVDAVLTACTVAVAETGTVVLDAGPGQGRRALSLVPDHHVAVVRAADVVADVPDALARLNPLRPQTWISGPSATSDIELDRVEGVHGPRRLDVVLVS
jgi:L-lactate dehydrogenase complex protein LldG